MRHNLDRPSFVYGLISAAILACVIGAGTRKQERSPKYDVTNVMGGTGLQIVDHGLNKLYHYKRVKREGSVVYRLVETLDFSRAGKLELQAELIKVD